MKKSFASHFRGTPLLLATFLFPLSLLVAPGSVSGQNWIPADTPSQNTPEDMGQILASFQKPNAPGAAVAVISNGSVSFLGAFGKSSLELDQNLTTESVFNVASLAKQFTAFSIALLDEQGALSLDDDIRTYLPEVKDFGAPITIRHLIHHTSGLRDALGMLYLAGWGPHDLISQDDVLRMIERQSEVDHAPGDRHLYSNTNYALLPIIIERVTGESFTTWTQENIFRPLGMTSTQFADSPELVIPNRAQSYGTTPDGAFARMPDMWYQMGSGGLYTTVSDMARWIQNLSSGRVGGTAVRDRMRERGILNDGTVLSYAFGLGHGENLGLANLGHGGSGPGVQASLRFYPEQEFGSIVLSNSGGTSWNISDLVQQIAEAHLGELAKPTTVDLSNRRSTFITQEQLDATPTGSYTPDPDEFDDYTGTYELSRVDGSEDDVLIGALIIILRDEDRLLLAFGEPPGIPLTPIGPGRFLLAPLGTEIHFDADDGPEDALLFRVTESSPRGVARDLRGTKHHARELTAAVRQEYHGTYYSAELETLYRVTSRGDQLIVAHPRHGSAVLSLVADDEFTADSAAFSTVTFGRDHRGEVVTMGLKGVSWSSSAILKRVQL